MDMQRAFRAIMSDPDGRRIIERAFRADPKQTAIELCYIGELSLAGELEVALRVSERRALKVTTLAEAAAGPHGEVVRAARS